MERTAHRECPLNSGCGLQLLRMALLYLIQSINVCQIHSGTRLDLSPKNHIRLPLSSVGKHSSPNIVQVPKTTALPSTFSNQRNAGSAAPMKCLDTSRHSPNCWYRMIGHRKMASRENMKNFKKGWVQSTLIWDASKES